MMNGEVLARSTSLQKESELKKQAQTLQASIDSTYTEVKAEFGALERSRNQSLTLHESSIELKAKADVREVIIYFGILMYEGLTSVFV